MAKVGTPRSRVGTPSRVAVIGPGEAVGDRIFAVPALAAEGDAQGAAAHYYGGGAMAYCFVQSRIDLGFEIQMGVDVQQPRHQPLAGGIDDFGGCLDLQVGATGQDLAVADGQVLDLGQ